MARLRIETAPEITVYDESFVIKAAAGASAPLAEFKDSSGNVKANISSDGILNVTSVVSSNAGTSSTSLATRAYVDTVVSGMNWHAAADYATAAALPACTYANGTAGVGATLTGDSNGRLTVDGSAQTTGKSILVKNQVDGNQNGIYYITAQGVDGSAAFVLTRRSDSDNSIAGQVKAGDAIYIVGGTNNGGQAFTLTTTGTGTSGAIVFGTDSLAYTQFTGTATFTAGSGLVSTGNVVDIVTASSSRIVINADSIDLATVSQTNTSGANTTSFISGHTVDSYGRITATETSSVSFAGYATLDAPALTGVPTAPTAANATSNTQLATTEFVQNAATIAVSTAGNNAVLKSLIDAKGDLVVGTADNTVNRLAAGTNGYYLRANSAETTGLEWASIPTVNTLDDVGDVTITTATSGDLLKWSGSAWVNAAGYALLDSPALTGTPTAPTATAAANTTQIATTEFVTTADALKANLANPTFTGTVTAADVTLTGNLTVSGTTTTFNTETLTIDDNIIILNNNEAGTPSQNAGIEVERGTSTNVLLRWNETTDCWEFTNDGTNYQRIITDTVTNAQAASYTLALEDSGKMIEMGVASGNTLTVPPNSSVAFPVGTTLTVLQTGAGQCTLTAGAGVTLNGTPGLKLRTTWSSATLIKRATDTWVALGDMVA
jgi:hypothetical protein